MQIQQMNIKEEALKNELKLLFKKPEFVLHQQLIKRLCAQLKVTELDCAAALSLLNHADLVSGEQRETIPTVEKIVVEKAGIEKNQPVQPKQKSVRYRLDVGRKHAATVDKVKEVLIEVSGVDKNRIGRLDVRNYYTLVDLPVGMPADIFQLLSEVEINQRKLNLKRVKYQPRFYRRNNKPQSA